tara:strand:+ start:748 stop:924 length:177 start_codon:yes stop_codon:yes gene_type:complete
MSHKEQQDPEVIIDEYVKKIKSKEIDKDQALTDLMNNKNVSDYFDKVDIELILDFETD